MEETTTYYRAVYRYNNSAFGATYRPNRDDVIEAYNDADSMAAALLDSGRAIEGTVSVERVDVITHVYTASVVLR
jgi:hypothetical protein